MRARTVVLVLALAACGGDEQEAADPQAVVEELLAADRAFAAAAAGKELPEALGAMFDDSVFMPAPPGVMVHGRDSAIATMRANPANVGAHVEWSPIRGGISADGQQGFTFGYMTTRRADGTTAYGKYLGYWVKRPEGWRVAVYRRGGSPDSAGAAPMMPPALPAAMVPVDESKRAIYMASVDSVERAFSDEAQRIGLGPAFKDFGSADAVNMGRNARFTVSADSIAAGFPDYGPTSPVNWSAERVIAASSGDLGVTIGFIRDNEVAEGAVPFFTVWRRASPTARWLYIAE